MLEKIIRYLLKNQVILALTIILICWFIIQTRDILVLFFLAYIVMAALLPFVSFLKTKHLPKLLTVIIPYIGVLFILISLAFLLVPFITAQIQSLFSIFPQYLNHSANIFGFKTDPKQIQNYISNDYSILGSNALAVTGQLFGGVFSLLTIFIVSFYMLVYHEHFQNWLAGLASPHSHLRIIKILGEIDDRLGAWLRGQVVLSFFVGLFSWIALALLHVPYALPLAIIAGFLEILPTIGPILSAIPSVIVALTVSPSLAFWVVVAYIIIQLLESNLLVPNVMQKAVGLNPIVVIFGITIGVTLMGITGALLSLPFISFLVVLFNSIHAEEPSK